MKKFWLLAAWCAGILTVTPAAAEDKELPAYGDLYNVQWCPCNPEEPYDSQGAVVQGKTVMCPCDDMFSGFKKGFDEDIRDIKMAAKNQLRRLNYFKYYVGMDYNIGSPSAADDLLVFDDIRFASGPINVSPESIVEDQDSLSFVVGARVNKWFGLEAFYQKTYQDNTVSQIDYSTLNASPTAHYLMNEYTTSFSAYGLDLIGYVPISPYFDVVAALGIAQYKFDNKATFAVYQFDGTNLNTVLNRKFDDENWGWRAGLGAQVNVADGVALRGMYRYISLDGDVIKDMNELSLGVRFLF